MNPHPPLLDLDLPGLERHGRGKVREIFSVDADRLLLVATDRVSAFDQVFAEGIPHKGLVLTHVSRFWFERLASLCPHHLITTDVDRMPEVVRRSEGLLRGRSMLVRRAEPLPVEFVVRGYLAGSGWAEYRERGSICGVELPPGLGESARLPEPILTPTTKAQEGHDLPLTFAEVEERLGADLAHRARDVALALYREALAVAEARGLVLADTKFEFGLRDGDLVWIDEALTPDSSRYWERDTVREGEHQEAFDKQVLRDHVLAQGWDRRPPPPHLDADIVAETSRRYLELARRLTGEDPLSSLAAAGEQP